MSHVLRSLPDMLRVGFAGVVAYRAEMMIWMLSATMPLIMLALWNAVASDGPVAGMDQVEIARYFACTLLVRQLTSVWLVWELNDQIRHGRLSNLLLKPMHPLIQHGIDMVCAVPFRAFVLVPMLGLLLLWRPELWLTPELGRTALFLVSLVLAWLINFLIQALFGILAFWMEKSDALFGVWFALYSLLSGYVAPLAVFPESVRPVLMALPFRGMLGLPVEILGGFLSNTDAALEIGGQLGWVVILWLAVRWAWDRGVARYGAYGA